MQRYSDFRPTCFDPKGAFLDDDRRSWFVAPVSQTRDSGPFEVSNFNAALEILGGESDTVEVHRFGHWGPGWFEIILVHPSRESDVQGIEDSLENYPCLDEEDLSRREHEDAMESWDDWARRDFRREIMKACGAMTNDDVTLDSIEEYLDNADDEDLFDLFRHAGGEYWCEGSGTTFRFPTVGKAEIVNFTGISL